MKTYIVCVKSIDAFDSVAAIVRSFIDAEILTALRTSLILIVRCSEQERLNIGHISGVVSISEDQPMELIRPVNF